MHTEVYYCEVFKTKCLLTIPRWFIRFDDELKNTETSLDPIMLNLCNQHWTTNKEIAKYMSVCKNNLTLSLTFLYITCWCTFLFLPRPIINFTSFHIVMLFITVEHSCANHIRTLFLSLKKHLLTMKTWNGILQMNGFTN